MTDRKRRPSKKRPGSHRKSPYFLQPGKQGAVTVFRRPAGNRIDAKLCGSMASRAMALALVKQLEKAESVVHDLFLEATDDGIEALDAVLDACRQSVTRRADTFAASGEGRGSVPGGGPGGSGKGRRGRGRRRGAAAPPRDRPSADAAVSAPGPGAEDTSAA